MNEDSFMREDKTQGSPSKRDKALAMSTLRIGGSDEVFQSR